MTTTADIISQMLEQRETAARNWERQSNEWEARWRAVTTERDNLRLELAAAHTLIADLESRLGEAQQGLYAMEEQQQ